MVRLLVGRNVSVRFQPVQILLGCVTVEGHFTATIVAMSVVVVVMVRQMVVIVLRAVVVILPGYRCKKGEKNLINSQINKNVCIYLQTFRTS